MNLTPNSSLKRTGLERIVLVGWKALRLDQNAGIIQFKDLQKVCLVSLNKEKMEGLAERQTGFRDGFAFEGV